MAEPNTALCCSDHTEEEVPAATPDGTAETIIGILVAMRHLSEVAGLSFRELNTQAFCRFVNEQIDKAQAGKVQP